MSRKREGGVLPLRDLITPPIGERSVTIHNEAAKALCAIASRARGDGIEKTKLLDDVRNALDGYSIERRSSITFPEWRRYLLKLAKASRALVSVIDDGRMPGAAFKQPLVLPHLPIDASVYSFLSHVYADRRPIDANSVGIKNLDIFTPRAEWMEAVFSANLPAKLTAIAETAEAASNELATRGKDTDLPNRNLGRQLAGIWNRHTLAEIVDSRAPDDGSQQGDFAEFAHAALSALDAELRPTSDDSIIRMGAQFARKAAK